MAKTIGMSEIARKSGLNRQNLYRSLADGAAPRLDTILSVMRALGLRLTPGGRPTN